MGSFFGRHQDPAGLVSERHSVTAAMRPSGDDGEVDALLRVTGSDAGTSSGTPSLSDQRSGGFAKRTYTVPAASPSTFDDLEHAAPTAACTGKPGAAPDIITKWRVLSPAAYSQAPGWDLPWGWVTIVLALIAWSVVEFVFAFLTVAATLLLMFRGWESTTEDQSGGSVQSTAVAFCFQVILTGVAVTMVHLLGSCQPHRLPEDWLRTSLRDPFKPPCGWAAWAVLGTLAAPAAAVVATLPSYVLPSALTGGVGTVDGIAGSGDIRVFALLAVTEGVLAPLQEEVVFRGFFMASMTKYMSMPAAAAASSGIFAALHFNRQDFLSLWGLGFVMGVVYGRSRNLASSMAVHSAWNLAVLAWTFSWLHHGHSMQELQGVPQHQA